MKNYKKKTYAKTRMQARIKSKLVNHHFIKICNRKALENTLRLKIIHKIRLIIK